MRLAMAASFAGLNPGEGGLWIDPRAGNVAEKTLSTACANSFDGEGGLVAFSSMVWSASVAVWPALRHAQAACMAHKWHPSPGGGHGGSEVGVFI
jgi:hypothetical protein